MGEYITVTGLARKLGISGSAVRQAILAGKAPEAQLRGPSGTRLYSKDEARAVLVALGGRPSWIP